tara:strand:+ start:395 stop:676 length:282 start_codon:yes stop_codon:yes gene_type:complete
MSKQLQFPFVQTKLANNKALRTFNESIDSSELIWHMDKEDRIITVLKSSNWKLQMDNGLPIQLERGRSYFIPKMTYHRVIKGSGSLVLELQFL